MREHSLKISGNSMLPTIRDGDSITCLESLKKTGLGDIIVYYDKLTKEITCHRIIELDPIRTKGDNSNTIDEVFRDSHFCIVTRVNNKHWGEKGQSLKHLIAYNSKYLMRGKFLRKAGKLFFYFLNLF